MSQKPSPVEDPSSELRSINNGPSRVTVFVGRKKNTYLKTRHTYRVPSETFINDTSGSRRVPRMSSWRPPGTSGIRSRCFFSGRAKTRDDGKGENETNEKIARTRDSHVSPILRNAHGRHTRAHASTVFKNDVQTIRAHQHRTAGRPYGNWFARPSGGRPVARALLRVSE